MRKFCTLLTVVVLTVSIAAQSPQKMSYQAVVRNSSNELVKSSPVGMRISILRSSATGTEVYKEIFNPNPQTNSNGLVTIEIGAGTVITGIFANIDWSSGPCFLKTETDPTGGTNYTISGTSQLLSVPYALYSKTSQDAGGLKQQIKILEDNLIAAGTYKLADIDGNQYDVVKIGTQVWMKENLKTTKYNDNSSIPLVTDNTVWASLSTPGFCWYNNDAAAYKATYGAMYNGYAVGVASNGGKNVCPTGWHVPTDPEWTTLTNYLGGEIVAGGKLKEAGLTHWASANTGATNETGFTALPGGNRSNTGTFLSLGYYGFWWSSTEYSTAYGWGRVMFYGISNINTVSGKRDGFSVRCVRDF